MSATPHHHRHARGLLRARLPMVRRSFTLIELIVAAGLFGLLLACVHGSLENLRRMDREFQTEHRAVTVLGNVVERAAAENACTESVVRRVFHEEMQASELASRTDLLCTCTTEEHNLVLSISWQSGHPVAELRVPLHEQN